MENGMNATYLTTDELSGRIKYDSRTIRERLKDSVLLEGVHYIRPFGGRKILYIWEAIERDIKLASAAGIAIPMANGEVCHG
jgi:histidinol phosphatase-like PHP family hydrolase